MRSSWSVGGVVYAGMAVPMMFGSVAFGDGFDGVVDSLASSAMLSGSVEVHNAGILIGDFDAKTNPDGTSTRPGFFGGSGNNPIDMELTGAIDANLDTNPTGMMSISVDFDALTIDLAGLDIDLLGGQSGEAQPSVSMIYDTFNTVNPSFIYPGGIPFEFPIGQGSSIDQALATQTGPGLGVLTPTADPDVFGFTMAVPAELAMGFTIGFDGVDPPADGVEPLAVVLPLSGTIERLGDGGVVMLMTIETQQIDQVTPIEGVTSPEIPFELPTLGADAAGVLFTLSPDLLIFGVDYGWSLVVNGMPSVCAADLVEDGLLNFFDVSEFLVLYGDQDPRADFVSDGLFNFFDVSAFLEAYGAGCP